MNGGETLEQNLAGSAIGTVVVKLALFLGSAGLLLRGGVELIAHVGGSEADISP